MADDLRGPRTSRQVTILDAARYEDGPVAVARVTGITGFAFPRVQFADGRTVDMIPGQVAVRFGPDDVGLMDAGEYRRWFG